MAAQSKDGAVRFGANDTLLPPQAAGPTHSELNLREALDLWEHANFLFHNYEWEEAVTAYRRLLKRGSTPFSKGQIWFNIGVVRCHLGEYFLASEAFTKALKNDNKLALGWYMLGFTAFELGDFRKARRWFLACLSFFQESVEQIDYGPLGVDFVLVKIKVVWNERQAMFEKEHKRSRAPMPLDTHYTLNRMPAGLIFEPHPDQIMETRRKRNEEFSYDDMSHQHRQGAETIQELDPVSDRTKHASRRGTAPNSISPKTLERVRSLFSRRSKSESGSEASGVYRAATWSSESAKPSQTPTAHPAITARSGSSSTYLRAKPLPSLPSDRTDDLADDDSCVVEDPFIYDRQSLLHVPESRSKHDSFAGLQRHNAARRLEGEHLPLPEGQWWDSNTPLKAAFGKSGVIEDGEGGPEDQILLPFNRPSWDNSRAPPSWNVHARPPEMQQKPRRGPWWEFEISSRPTSSLYSQASVLHDMELMAGLSIRRKDHNPLARVPADHPARVTLLKKLAAAAVPTREAVRRRPVVTSNVRRQSRRGILDDAVTEHAEQKRNIESDRVTVDSAEFFYMGKDPGLLERRSRWGKLSEQ